MLKDRDFSEMFIQTLEQAIDSVVVIDAENRVIFFNKAAEQLWGYSREEIIGNNVRILVPPDIQGHHDGYVDNNRQTGINRIVGTFRTVPIHRKDGEQRWGSMSISKVKSGNDIIYTAFVKDVTVQYEKEEHTRLLSLVANVTDSATIITDAQWNIVYVNDGFTRTFGYTFDEVKGKSPLTLLMPHIESTAIEDIQTRLANGQSSNAEELTYTSNGERMWSTIVTNPVMNDAGKLINTVSVLTDITYSKMYQVLQNRVLTAMAHEQPLENIMLLICNELERILPDFYIAVLRVEEQQTLSVLASPSFPQRYNQVIEGIKIGPAVGSCGTAAYRGEDVSVSDIRTDPLWVDFQELAQTLDASSCWSVPVKNNNDRVLGVMAFYHQKNHTPSESERKLVEIAVPLCALALEREESRAHIRQLAFYDSLTGLPNRSLLHAEAERALLDAQKHKHTMAVFFFDLDRFKQVIASCGRALNYDRAAVRPS
jgi:PAS domain S-box-containing protein